MNKLTRLGLWGGLFVATVALALGVSFLVLRVRAAVDSGRVRGGVEDMGLLSGASLADQGLVALEAGVTPTACPLVQTECSLPGNANPTGQTTPQPPTTDVPGQTYRDCCGVLRWVPTPVPSLPVNPGGAAEPAPTPSCH
jgi:hypothetical protein